MTTALKAYAITAGERGEYSMHSFHFGGAISQALAGEKLITLDYAASFLEAAEHGLEIYASHTSRRARIKGSLRARRRFERRVPPDE